MKEKSEPSLKNILKKTPTGIQGLDEITGGGLPKGRPTLICGNAGCGKTLLSLEFLLQGASRYNDPGVFVSFEETEKELATNVASLGYDLNKLTKEKKIKTDYIHIDHSESAITGYFDLEGLFVRLNYSIERIGAKRIVLDTIDSLFTGLPHPLIVRSELRRLFRWLKEKGITAIVTAERGGDTFTRQGLEEYVSDCVIMLDHRVTEQISTRRLRILKYRGTSHGTNEYPFLIDETGFSVFPITSVGLGHAASAERISTGIPRLDAMLGGQGYFRGSSVLVSGTAGTGKSSIAAHFSAAACQRGEHVLYFALEESPSQIIRNMRSIGINLEQFVQKGLLKFYANRPTFSGLESYLTVMYKEVSLFKPLVVIIDPVSSFLIGTNEFDAKSMIMRMVDFLKSNFITGFMTNLSSGNTYLEHTQINISSLIDTWLLLRDIEIGGERNRGIYILKSRGMKHSNQIREFLITDHGVDLIDVYVGPDGVLTGSARLAQEAKENAGLLLRQQEITRRKQEIEHHRKAMEGQVALLKAEFEALKTETDTFIQVEEKAIEEFEQSRKAMEKIRNAYDPGNETVTIK